MTTAIARLASAPTSGSVRMARVHAAIDELATSEVGRVHGRDVAEIDRAIARLESVKLRMVAAADRQGAGTESGMSGTPAWLAAHTRSWGAKAAADVSLATALESSLPATKEALAAGTLSTAHAAVIAGTAGRLPESLTDAERTRVETALVEQAKHVDPARLRRAARRALLAAERSAEEVRAHEDAELRDEESRARRRVRLTMHDNLDGTVSGHFTVPTLAAAILRKTIQQMVSPRRHAAQAGGSGGAFARGDAPDRGFGPVTASNQGSGPAAIADSGAAFGTGSGSTSGAGPVSRTGSGAGSGTRTHGTHHTQQATGDRDWAHDYGSAFVELLEHLPTDRLGGKVAATVVVTIDHDQLREALGAAHLDTGNDLSASEARRLACSAGILPAVLDGSTLPLDLGRTKRFFTESQRVALATTYDSCAADGCDRPFAWSELHHEDPWARGGATDLSLGVPLCGTHHQRAHDPRYDHRVHTDTDGRKCVTFHRRT